MIKKANIIPLYLLPSLSSISNIQNDIFYGILFVIIIIILLKGIWDILNLSPVHNPILHTKEKQDNNENKENIINIRYVRVLYNVFKHKLPTNNLEKKWSQEYMALYDESDVSCKKAWLVFSYSYKDIYKVIINVDGVRRVALIDTSHLARPCIHKPSYTDIMQKPLYTPTTLGIENPALFSSLTIVRNSSNGFKVDGIWAKRPKEHILLINNIKIYSNHQPIRTDGNRKMFIIGKDV